jgi:phosphate starvation-inducible protein PhoH
MKRKSKISIMLLSAAITFGTLAVVVGKPHFAKHHNIEKCHKHQHEK